MKMKRKNQMLFLFAAYFSLLPKTCGKQAEFSMNQNGVRPVDEVHVGVILDMGSMEGKTIHSFVSMAISDFYSFHTDYRVRIVLHSRDSKGDPLLALSTAFDLLENAKVGVIPSAQTSTTEAKFLAELGDKTNIPVISFSTVFGSSPSLNNYPYFNIQDEIAEVEGIVAVIEMHYWENIILICEDSDNWNDFFEERKIHIAYKSAVATSAKDDELIEELHKLKAMQTTVFVVHVSHVLATRLFLNAKRLGMISEGYAWIVTSKSMNHLQYLTDFSIFESMQGVLGFRSSFTESKELHNFTARMIKEVYNKELDIVEMENLSLFGVRAYDVAWSLAQTANSLVLNVPEISDPDARLNLMEFDNFRTNTQGSVLLKEIFQNISLSGEFQFINGKLISSTFEILNVMGKGERRVGFWTSAGKITRKLQGSTHGRYLSSINELETIIWPGGTSTIPKGRMMQTSSNILRIGVPVIKGFTQLVKVDRDLQTNTTIVTGFCIDVFKAALEGLKYEVQYQFVPMELVHDSYHTGGNYNDLVYQVYLQRYDAVVGDTTITANRSLYVDFTLPFTDLGVGMVTRLAPKESKNLWIFLKPLTGGLWVTIVGVYLLMASLIWLIERPASVDRQGQQSNRQDGRIVWFSFSILVFAHWEKLSNNLSRSVVVIWVFVVFILSSSYTATLTSMMTVRQLELNSKMSHIGHQIGPVTQEVISNLNLVNTSTMWLYSPEEYANALSKGSDNGGVSSIIDEIPYLKIFLAKYSAHFSMIGPIMPTTNGFGFVFPKGSPLVSDISREIAKLREVGRLQMLENAWFKSPTVFASGDTSNSVDPLTVGDFRGLFIISGTFSTSAFLLFLGSVLYRNWHIVRKWRRPESVKEYVSMVIFRNRRESNNVIHPELANA